MNDNNRENISLMAFEDKGFCAVLNEDGTTKKIDSATISDFLQVVEKGCIAWIDFVITDFKKDGLAVAKSLGFSEGLAKTLIKKQKSEYEDLTTEMGVLIPAIIAKGFDVKIEKLIILIKENLIVTLHTTEVKRFFRLRRYAETFLKKLPQKMTRPDKITSILIRLLDENNARNFKHLQEIEEKGDELSKYLADLRTPRAIIGAEIPKMKHALSLYLGGLWATLDVLNSLRYGDADLLTDDIRILEKLGMLVNEVNTQIGLAEHLSTVLASGLEVIQSIYNNQLQILNNRLAMLVSYLTIIGTALLVPNTIATIVGNPMFNFKPEDLSWYLPLLIISTIIATILAWHVMEKMGFLPKKEEIL